MVQLSHLFMTTGKTILWLYRHLSLLFNSLCRFVIAFLPRSKQLLISWLQSPSAVISEPKKRKSVMISTFPVYLPWSNGTRCHDLSCFEFWVSCQFFHITLSPSSRNSLVPLHSAIRVISSTVLWLLMEILIPACDSSSPALLMIYSAYIVNEQGHNIQP